MLNKYNNILIKKILIDAFKCMTYKRNSYSTLVRCISNAIIKDELKYTEVLKTFKSDIDEFLENNKKNCIYNISMFYKKPKMLEANLNEKLILNLRLTSNQIKSLMLIIDLVESYKEEIRDDLKEKLCRSKNISIKQYYNQLASKGKRVFSPRDVKWNSKRIKK
ncbi:TPA: hypothetical protein RTG63_001679 [Campylobacter jejuni]|nr:hypothetical protein [Campylobacter jejuni]